MAQIFVAFLLALLALSSARADPIHFIAIAEVEEKNQAQYDRFVTQVKPIWKKHGMNVVARLKVVDSFGSTSHDLAPSELLLLRVETRAGFQAYIADPDYQKISNQRLEAVSRLIILEADLLTSQRLEFFDKQPMGAFIFSNTLKEKSANNLHLRVTLTAHVKGENSTFLQSVKTLEVAGISFDDNPTDYLRNEDGADALVFIGEQVR